MSGYGHIAHKQRQARRQADRSRAGIVEPQNNSKYLRQLAAALAIRTHAHDSIVANVSVMLEHKQLELPRKLLFEFSCVILCVCVCVCVCVCLLSWLSAVRCF